MEEVLIAVDTEGNVSVEVKGIQGPRCLEFSKSIEKSLGAVSEMKEKPEMREVETHGRIENRA